MNNEQYSNNKNENNENNTNELREKTASSDNTEKNDGITANTAENNNEYTAPETVTEKAADDKVGENIAPSENEQPTNEQPINGASENVPPQYDRSVNTYSYGQYGYRDPNARYNSTPHTQEAPRYSNSQYGSYSYDPQYANRYAPQNDRPQYTYAPNGVHNENRQAPKKRRKSKAGIIAAAVAGCILISTIFGAGGALITSRVINGASNAPVSGESDGNISPSNNGIIGDAETTTAAADRNNPAVIYKANEAIDNTGRYSDDPIVNAAAVAGVSVVEITTEVVQTNSFYGQYVTEGAGSGVIITEDGYIITCAHVISGASAVTVRLKDGTEYPATIIGEDAQTDIAVIRVEADDLTPAVIANSDNLLVGQTAVAIGNPLGELGGSVSSGIISALDREIEIEGDKYNLLQTTAAINPGNSGGGLFNINGELIGIVNAKQSGSSIEGLGFSIPVNQAMDIAEQLINHGYIRGRVRMGISVYEVTASTNTYQLYNEIPALINYVTTYGVYFTEYDGNSGDLKFGDRIVAIDGVTVTTFADIRSLLTEYEIGDTVTVTVARLMTNGRSTQSKMVDVSLTLIESIPE